MFTEKRGGPAGRPGHVKVEQGRRRRAPPARGVRPGRLHPSKADVKKNAAVQLGARFKSVHDTWFKRHATCRCGRVGALILPSEGGVCLFENLYTSPPPTPQTDISRKAEMQTDGTKTDGLDFLLQQNERIFFKTRTRSAPVSQKLISPKKGSIRRYAPLVEANGLKSGRIDFQYSEGTQLLEIVQ